MAHLSDSFRLKIALLSVALSGIVVVAMGITFVHVMRRIGVSRIDKEIASLAESNLRIHPPPNHWRILGNSLHYIYGEDYEQQIILKVVTQDGILYHASPGWPADAFDHQLALPKQTGELTEDSSTPLPPQGPPAARRPGQRTGVGQPPPPFGGRPRVQQEQNRLPLPPPRFRTLADGNTLWRVGTIDTERIALAIGINLEQVMDENDRVLLVLAIAGPLALLLLGFAGWFLACRALQPVSVIVQTAKAIHAQDLSQRIPAMRSDREFTELVDTINGMLSRLERSFEQAARFSADAAHELKTPLTILQGQLDQGIQDAADGSHEQQCYSDLLEEVVRLKNITAKLLLLAQADSGRLAITREPMHLTDAVRLCAEDLDHQAGDVSLETQIQDDVWVDADPVLIRHVLANLLSNALKYNVDHGKLQIILQSRQGYATLHVRNTGSSIPLEARERIFERFFRVDAAHARTRDGIGLGLSLAREIARGHDGDLCLEPADAGWIAFRLTLPATTPPTAN